jgi:hypothetical protein
LQQLLSEQGELSEFGVLATGFVGSVLSSAYIAWLSTGRVFQRTDRPAVGENISSTLRVGFIGSPLAISLLSAAWLSVWLYASLLSDTLRASLLDGTLGFSLDPVEVERIATNLIGLLGMGVTLPLLAATAFIGGWACSIPLRLKLMLLPSGAYLLISIVSNYGVEILQTGHPPMLSALQRTGYLSNEAPTLAFIGLFWFLYFASLVLAAVLLAFYGRIWTFIGFKLRRAVVHSET